MSSTRRQNILRRRRRVEDEGEDEGSIAADLIDDSQSDASLPSDLDDDADADDSDLSDTEGPNAVDSNIKASKPNGAAKVQLPQAAQTAEVHDITFSSIQDTEVMMNGLKLSGSEEAIDFDTLEQPKTEVKERKARPEAEERPKRDHEEYKKKRDADPAFVPNRGAFFMHDHRTASPGHNGFRPFAGRGRGRGRGGIGGPYAPAPPAVQPEPASGVWAHDLHDTLQEPTKPGAQQPRQQQKPAPTAPAAAGPDTPALPVRQFSTTKLLGNIQIRVSLPGMKAPIIFQGVPYHQHTKLPNHRPPLRRDKPVRISLPDKPPRYIFPATERSFIFIPRALRPNQQGFGRGKGRGMSSYGGFSSRRTSAYGGSVYSPSIAAMSRRSSLAREFNRDGLGSPTGPARPVVRLPPGSQQHTAVGTPVHHPATMSGHSTPMTPHMQSHGYPMPQKPVFRENWAHQLHQPRPQKTISVAGIESPASNMYSQDHQPFQHQLPAHVNGEAFYPGRGQYPTQTAGSTPLSNIPERAIHAQPFQPFQQAYPQSYFYPGQQAYAGGQVIAPMLVQNGQQGYLVPTIAPAGPPAGPPAVQPVQGTVAGQQAMVAYEQNGMVYYYDPQAYGAAPEQAESFTPAQNYAVPVMNPNAYYYPQVPGAVYYPQQ
ncbi:hypothetical protein EJ06DRAFT_303467 [Trichodelitschia bisporula]|uniref:Btz domain-containing protein n=1 Tax=Trichodelitschia bisporula TaxID=703511 RepID=A0A6G1I6W0_9PEZI|nr:hypothetical protein EJ06DRAFT_303467 [Trichodelitschia bisporula]